MNFTMHSKRTRQISSASAAFTLIELMVVIVIMSLIVAMAIPALRSIMGTRSNEVAMNKVSAYLGNARLQAIGLVEEVGVLFYIDPQTQLVTMTTVYTTPSLQGAGSTMTGPSPQKAAIPIHYVDLVPNNLTETLPAGVGFQVLNSWFGLSVSGFTNEYAGYMSAPEGGVAPFFAGLILFDNQGHVLTVPYGCRCQTLSSGTPTGTASGMGQLIYGPQSSPPVTYIPGGSSSIAPSTAFAFTLYDPEAFNNAGNSAEQPSSSQDTWLDSNGLEVLISRDSGMLLKSE